MKQLVKGVLIVYQIVGVLVALYSIIPFVGMIFGYNFFETAKTPACIICGSIVSVIAFFGIILINEENNKK